MSESETDIYDDLPDFLFGEKEELQGNINELIEKNEALQARLQKTILSKKELEEKHQIVSSNFSMLFKTAQAEINRKDKTIKNLRDELDKCQCRKRKWNGENVYNSSQNDVKRYRIPPKSDISPVINQTPNQETPKNDIKTRSQSKNISKENIVPVNLIKPINTPVTLFSQRMSLRNQKLTEQELLNEKDVTKVDKDTLKENPSSISKINGVVKEKNKVEEPKINEIKDSKNGQDDYKGKRIARRSRCPINPISKDWNVKNSTKTSMEPPISKIVKNSSSISKDPIVKNSPSISKDPIVKNSPQILKDPIVKDSPQISKESLVKNLPLISKDPIVKNSLQILKDSIVKNSPKISKESIVKNLPLISKDSNVKNSPPPKAMEPPVKKLKKTQVSNKMMIDIFGSPTKWADSSSNDEDVPKTDFTSPAVFEDSCSAQIDNSRFAEKAKTVEALNSAIKDNRPFQNINKPKNHNEDTLIGQFETTTQFISSLTLVQHKLSPLNTPIKPETDKPVNILQPRKTPRIVTKPTDKPLIKTFSLKDSFLSEQEEKVKNLKTINDKIIHVSPKNEKKRVEWVLKRLDLQPKPTTRRKSLNMDISPRKPQSQSNLIIKNPEPPVINVINENITKLDISTKDLTNKNLDNIQNTPKTKETHKKDEVFKIIRSNRKIKLSNSDNPGKVVVTKYRPISFSSTDI